MIILKIYGDEGIVDIRLFFYGKDLEFCRKFCDTSLI